MKLIIAAMHDEIKDMIKDYKQVLFHPFEIYQKEDQIICRSGIGKVNASFALTTVLSRYPIEQIINIGFAGGTKPLSVGDSVLIDQAGYHDFDLTAFNYEKGQVPGLPRFFESNPVLLEELKSKYKSVQLSTLYTGDYFMKKPLKEEGYVVDMEGAALYQVAYLAKVPIVSVKVISDIINNDDQMNTYESFEKKGSKLIKENIRKLLEVKL